MKKPRLRNQKAQQPGRPNLEGAKQVKCHKCGHGLFDQKFIILEASALSPNPGTHVTPALVCVNDKCGASWPPVEEKKTK